MARKTTKPEIEELDDVIEEIDTTVDDGEIDEIENEELEDEDAPKLISLRVAKTIIHNGRVYVANEKIELEKEHAKMLVKKGYVHSPKK